MEGTRRFHHRASYRERDHTERDFTTEHTEITERKTEEKRREKGNREKKRRLLAHHHHRAGI
jgi:hypothetical protein